MAELKGETAGKLRLGVIPTIAPYLLHKFIPAFVRDYPKVELEISEMITSEIVEALKRDRIDAALVASGTCGEGILEQELFSDRFYAYVSPENPLYERQNIRIEEIDLKDLVILSPGNCMRDQIIELCQARRSMPAHYTFESGSLDTLMRIVDCTSCLTIIPEMAVEYIPADHLDRLKTLAKGGPRRARSPWPCVGPMSRTRSSGRSPRRFWPTSARRSLEAGTGLSHMNGRTRETGSCRYSIRLNR